MMLEQRYIQKNYDSLVRKSTAVYSLIFISLFVYFWVSVANAEEESGEVATSSSSAVADDKKRAEMMEQIKAIKQTLEEQKIQFQKRQKEIITDRKVEIDEIKGDIQQNRAQFMERIADLPLEEKRSAMLQYIEELKKLIAEKKAEMEAERAVLKEEREEMRQERLQSQEEFRANIANLTPEQKVIEIKKRVEELKKQVQERLNDDEKAEN